jgi:hypothetical protein
MQANFDEMSKLLKFMVILKVLKLLRYNLETIRFFPQTDLSLIEDIISAEIIEIKKST